jgi:cold shock CspA family protein
MTGIVKKVVADKGYGFIKGEDSIEYFFHKQDFNGFYDDLCEDLMKGVTVKVTFIIVNSPKGPRANEVTIADH